MFAATFSMIPVLWGRPVTGWGPNIGVEKGVISEEAYYEYDSLT